MVLMYMYRYIYIYVYAKCPTHTCKHLELYSVALFFIWKHLYIERNIFCRFSKSHIYICVYTYTHKHIQLVSIRSCIDRQAQMLSSLGWKKWRSKEHRHVHTKMFWDLQRRCYANKWPPTSLWWRSSWQSRRMQASAVSDESGYGLSSFIIRLVAKCTVWLRCTRQAAPLFCFSGFLSDRVLILLRVPYLHHPSPLRPHPRCRYIAYS